MTAHEVHIPLGEYQTPLDKLDVDCHQMQYEKFRELLLHAPTVFAPTDSIGDLLGL
ncbi:hypothetical protein [Vibrio sp. WXL210]|uniref:hypothetical protein n=1 Tax=Vibrio sp. WXL210 TaxID=3450709 RepID=UPI003EC50E44